VADTGSSIVWAAVAAATVTGVASISAAFIAKRIKIAEFRQAWINALRENIASYLKAIDTVRYHVDLIERPGATSDDLERLQNARNEAMLSYRLVLMRLNITEVAHIQLAQELNRLLVVKTRTPDTEQIDRVITHAREVLRHEWAVTKYGIVTRPIVKAKNWFKRRRSQTNSTAPEGTTKPKRGR
jgi:hypothetical protein